MLKSKRPEIFALVLKLEKQLLRNLKYGNSFAQIKFPTNLFSIAKSPFQLPFCRLAGTFICQIILFSPLANYLPHSLMWIIRYFWCQIDTAVFFKL